MGKTIEQRNLKSVTGPLFGIGNSVTFSNKSNTYILVDDTYKLRSNRETVSLTTNAKHPNPVMCQDKTFRLAVNGRNPLGD